MNPMRVEGCVLYGAPKNHDPEKDPPIGILPVFRDAENGCCISFWQFTDADRAKIAAGQNIALSVMGGQPPVLLFLTEAVGPVVILNPEPDENLS